MGDFFSFLLDYSFLFVILAIIITLIAQVRVHTTFQKASRIPTQNGMTGREAAELVLAQNGVRGVYITRSAGGHLSDHYDPRSDEIRLSAEVYDGRTAAAVGVAAHEAGHAVQAARGYAFFKVRMAIIPVTNYMSRAVFPLFLMGLVFDMLLLTQIGSVFLYLAIFAFSFSVIFQLVTLPCEYNASRRALRAVEASGYFSPSDCNGARRVLSAAALTYVAALFTSLVYLLRYIAIANARRR